MKIYKKIIKPRLFKRDPEDVHDSAIKIGSFLGSNFITKKLLKLFYNYENQKLNIEIKGIFFKNPVGLAAGFDKNAKLTQILPSIGFGFEEIGSITAKPCEGNPKPRLFRLPKDKAISVYYGLCNEGSEKILERLKTKKFEIPIGISIAKTNDPSIKGEDSVEDYYNSYKSLRNIGDYMTINISCPNTGDGRSFEDPVLLEKLLKKINNPTKLIFLKISPDIPKNNLDKIIRLSEKYFITGFVATNLTHNKNNLKTTKEELSKTKGAISGQPAREPSNNLIKYIYKKTKGKFIIIGVGGIFTAEDVYEKIKNGASLVQLITGMIYEGPSLIKEINEGLVNLLERDNFNNIKEAIGSNI